MACAALAYRLWIQLETLPMIGRASLTGALADAGPGARAGRARRRSTSGDWPSWPTWPRRDAQCWAVAEPNVAEWRPAIATGWIELLPAWPGQLGCGGGAAAMSSSEGRAPSVQATRIRLEAIESGVARFEGGHSCAALECTGGELDLHGEDRQEVAIAGLTRFLNALNFPVQLLVRAHPMDLRRYLERQEERARSGAAQPGACGPGPRPHAAFVRGLARQRTLLERRLYVVIPARLQAGAGRPASRGAASAGPAGSPGRQAPVGGGRPRRRAWSGC